MEIQTFLLAASISEGIPGNGNILNGTHIAIDGFFPNPGCQFPLEAQVPFLMVLRRQNSDTDELITLRLTLVDMDGRPMGWPRDLFMNEVFPRGKKLWKWKGKIPFMFPGPGDYRLDITADENKIPSIYSYCIEVNENKNG
jgi:hypothetical protein